VKKFIKEFRDFVATGNMVELAVAFILGLAVKAVIDAFIEHVANPLIGAIVGKPNLDDFLAFTLRKGTHNESTVQIGAVLTQVISLVVVGLVLFIAIKAYNRMRKPAEIMVAAPTEIELLTEIRDELRARR
jgi:large conductance mechanosensitive channel